MSNGFKFRSHYELTVDDKNRLLVPADVRRMIDPETDGKAFILTIGGNKRPWLYPEKYYEQELLDARPEDPLMDSDELSLQYLQYAMVWRVPMDNQGRILLPGPALARTRIGTDVALLGMKNHLELWNRSDWEAMQDQIFEQRGDLTARLRAARDERETRTQKPGD